MYLKLSLLVAIAIGACLCTNVEFNGKFNISSSELFFCTETHWGCVEDTIAAMQNSCDATQIAKNVESWYDVEWIFRHSVSHTLLFTCFYLFRYTLVNKCFFSQTEPNRIPNDQTEANLLSK